MTWYSTKAPAVDPDNPGADEQLPYDEYNAMVLYLKDKIIDKTVNAAAIADDKILVYKVASDSFVFETPSTTAILNDLTDVTISGVPANDEVLAYHTGTGWVNQTAAEAGLATVAELAALETAAVLNADYNATTFLYATADDTPQPKTPAEVMAILSGKAGAEFLFNTQKIGGIVNPTTPQQASTKNYADTHLFTKEAVTTFTDGYIPVYRTASGKFEMEAGGGSAGLPVADTTAIVKGSADGTKLVRFEVDGLTTGTTRVITVPDKHITLVGAEDSLFEEISSIIRERTGYDNDFVIGSPQLADDGDAAHDARMWFDKSKGAFRAGLATGTQWDDVNVGQYSHAEGYNTTASGYYSHAEGAFTTASEENSHAEGDGTTASGYYSHAEGAFTAASGYYSHAEGYNTTASGMSSHAEGQYSKAHLYAQHAKAAGRFTVDGDAQYSNVVARIETTDTTLTELTLDGGTPDADSRIILPANRTWAFSILIAARQTAGSGTIGDSGIYKIEGGIKRDGANNTALVGAITKTVIAEDQAAWDVTAVADDTNECLAIKVTGEASKTIHWVAKVDLVEVG